MFFIKAAPTHIPSNTMVGFPLCPLRDGEHTHVLKCCSVLIKEEILPFAVMCMNLEDIIVVK